MHLDEVKSLRMLQNTRKTSHALYSKRFSDCRSQQISIFVQLFSRRDHLSVRFGFVVPQCARLLQLGGGLG